MYSRLSPSGPLQIGAVDTIFRGGAEPARSVGPVMEEMRQGESDAAAVRDFIDSQIVDRAEGQVAVNAAEVSLNCQTPCSTLQIFLNHKL